MAGDRKTRQLLKNISIFLIGFFLILLIYNMALQRMPLSPEDGRVLLSIAESEIEGHAYNGSRSPRLFKKSPVFLSVYQKGSRVACVGYTKPIFSLYDSVSYLARGLSLDDKDDYEVVITVFSGYEPLNETGEIPVGRGVMVRRDGFEGVVLPFTFQEQNLTRDEALLLAAQKAGFTNYSWEDFEAYTFEAQVFRDG